MNYTTSYKILLLLFISNIVCFTNHFGQTYLWTRPLYSFFSIQQNLWFDMVFGKYCKQDFQIIGLAQKSNHGVDLNQYFFFNKPEVIVTSTNAKISSTERIRSQWLEGLPENFDGYFKIDPEETREGFFTTWRIDTSGNRRISFLNKSWIAISIPFEYVTHKLNSTYNAPDGAELKEALNKFKYSKLTPKTKSVGLSECRLELGFDFCSDERLAAFFSTFLGIPLEPKPTGVNLFEAVRGYTKNVAWGGSLYATFLLNCSLEQQFRFFLAMQNVYLVPNKQYRTLNLFGKPVSRYVRFVNKDGEKNLPGIDVLTRYCKVHSYNIGDISAGFVFRWCNFLTQLNYGFWVRGHEQVELSEPWPQDYYGIDAQKDGTTIDGFPLTASESSASFLAEPDKNKDDQYVFVPVQFRDLDFLSAGSRGTIVQRIEYSFGWQWNNDQSGLLGVGGYYEFKQNNCALPMSGAWVKIGFEF